MYCFWMMYGTKGILGLSVLHSGQISKLRQLSLRCLCENKRFIDGGDGFCSVGQFRTGLGHINSSPMGNIRYSGKKINS